MFVFLRCQVVRRGESDFRFSVLVIMVSGVTFQASGVRPSPRRSNHSRAGGDQAEVFIKFSARIALFAKPYKVQIQDAKP